MGEGHEHDFIPKSLLVLECRGSFSMNRKESPTKLVKNGIQQIDVFIPVIGQHSPAMALAVRAASTLPLVTLDTGRLSAKRLGSGYCRWYKRHWLIKLFEEVSYLDVK